MGLEEQREAAGLEKVVREAVERVLSLGLGLVLGLGTGRTSARFIGELARAAPPGAVECVIPTSFQSETAASKAGFRIGSLSNYSSVDVYVDSFDQCNVRGDLIKGMGGALAREKLLMTLARSVILIGTEEKLSETLNIPVPIEVLTFAAPAIPILLQRKGWRVVEKTSQGKAGPVITDNGNILMLADVGAINEPEKAEWELKVTPGIVEVGLCPRKGHRVLIGRRGGELLEIC
jgi:ribose 5-phosphate isomerase A